MLGFADEAPKGNERSGIPITGVFFPNETVEKVLTTGGIDTLIPVHYDLQAALAALQ